MKMYFMFHEHEHDPQRDIEKKDSQTTIQYQVMGTLFDISINRHFNPTCVCPLPVCNFPKPESNVLVPPPLLAVILTR